MSGGWFSALVRAGAAMLMLVVLSPGPADARTSAAGAGQARKGGLEHNPSHPLSDPQKDPGPEIQPADADSPGLNQFSGDWNWGELFYGREYPASLEVKNNCRSSETVTIFVNGLPLEAPRTVTIPGKSSRAVPLAIRTPQPPNPMLTGATGEPRIDRSSFTEVAGSVVVWHPWTRKCQPRRVEYKATGHIHYPPVTEPPPAEDGGAQQTAGADPCRVWWNTGEKPPQVEEEDCVAAIQALASEYWERVLGPFVESDPAAWSWLPSLEAIEGLSIGELLDMKARADAQIRGSAR